MNRQGQGCWLAALQAAAAGIWLAAGPAEAGEIRIWPTAVVSSDIVTLADLADLQGFDPATKERLGQLVVHGAPAEGGEIVVRPSDVRGALSEANADLASTQIFGSSRCKVSRPRSLPHPLASGKLEAQGSARRPSPGPRKAVENGAPATKGVDQTSRQAADPPANTLEGALRRYIEARVPDHKAKLEIGFSPANREDLSLRQGELQFEIRSRDEKKIGLLSFEVDVKRGGRLERTVPIVAEACLLKDVVVARRPINQGGLIEGRDLKLEQRRFSDWEAVGVSDLSAAVGQQCQRFVKPGEMLCASWLAPKALIARGDRVTIWSRQGGLVIKTTGAAQQTGSLGEVIEVRRDGAKRKEDLIQAEITGPGTVTVVGARQLAKR
jgi:flagella basal body P-ring formation protein FlgA